MEEKIQEAVNDIQRLIDVTEERTEKYINTGQYISAGLSKEYIAASLRFVKKYTKIVPKL